MKKVLHLLMWFLAVVFLLPVNSCKKKADESPPSISVSTPYDGQEFQVGDSIHVTATISSGSDISSLKISLVNDAGVPMLVPKYFFPGTKQYTVDYMFPINEDLDYKSYDLLVSATNTYQTSKVFTEVLITGPGRYFKQLIAVCQPNTLKTLIYSIKADGEQQNIMSLDYGYKASDLSSEEQQFYFLRPSPDILFAFDLDDLEVEFQIEAPQPHPQFNSVSYYPETSLLYLTDGNGQIRGYTRNGSLSFLTPLNEDTVPMHCWLHENTIYSYSERRGGPEKYILNFFRATGVYWKGKQLDFTVLDSYRVTVFDDVLVFGNDNSGSVGYYYSIIDNIIHGDFTMPEGNITQAEKITQFNYFLVAEEGIYEYDQHVAFLDLWLPDIEADVIAYDELREMLYVAEGSKLSLYRYPGAQLVQEVELPYKILNLHIQYNR